MRLQTLPIVESKRQSPVFRRLMIFLANVSQE